MDLDYTGDQIGETIKACFWGTHEIPLWARISILGFPIILWVWIYLEVFSTFFRRKQPAVSPLSPTSAPSLPVPYPKFTGDVVITLAISLFSGALFCIVWVSGFVESDTAPAIYGMLGATLLVASFWFLTKTLPLRPVFSSGRLIRFLFVVGLATNFGQAMLVAQAQHAVSSFYNIANFVWMTNEIEPSEFYAMKDYRISSSDRMCIVNFNRATWDILHDDFLEQPLSNEWFKVRLRETAPIQLDKAKKLGWQWENIASPVKYSKSVSDELLLSKPLSADEILQALESWKAFASIKWDAKEKNLTLTHLEHKWEESIKLASAVRLIVRGKRLWYVGTSPSTKLPRAGIHYVDWEQGVACSYWSGGMQSDVPRIAGINTSTLNLFFLTLLLAIVTLAPIFFLGEQKIRQLNQVR